MIAKGQVVSPIEQGLDVGLSDRSIAVERALAAYCRSLGMRFCFDGIPESGLRVLSPEMLLPVIVIHAEMAARRLIRERAGHIDAYGGIPAGQASTDHPLGSQLRPDSASLLGVYAAVPPLSSAAFASFRGLMFVYALHKVFGAGPVDVSVQRERQDTKKGPLAPYPPSPRSQPIECAGIFYQYASPGALEAANDLAAMGGSSQSKTSRGRGR